MLAVSGCGASHSGARHRASKLVRTPASCRRLTLTRAQATQALALAARRLLADTRAFTPGHYPSVTDRAGRWQLSSRDGWTSGFFPGTLWLTYARTHRADYERAARAWTAGLAPQAAVTSSHDLGFQILTSFGNGFSVTKAVHYRQVILRAAASLASRYDPAVGAVRSWGDRGDRSHFLVIVDGLMNLELLWWAAQHGGARQWAQMAVRDALTVRAHFIRRNGSLVHLVDFNPVTGRVQSEGNPQGYDLRSTWARGQAWAVAGFALAYGETHDRRFLGAARRTAAFFLRHLPGDCVPYWDFNAPGIPHAPRDSSAAAIAAYGLQTLGGLEPDRRRRAQDLHSAAALLSGLISHDLAHRGQAILAHGTANKPVGQYNTGTSYGDYYFVAALQREQQLAPAGS